MFFSSIFFSWTYYYPNDVDGSLNEADTDKIRKVLSNLEVRLPSSKETLQTPFLKWIDTTFVALPTRELIF